MLYYILVVIGNFPNCMCCACPSNGNLLIYSTNSIRTIDSCSVINILFFLFYAVLKRLCELYDDWHFRAICSYQMLRKTLAICSLEYRIDSPGFQRNFESNRGFRKDVPFSKPCRNPDKPLLRM